MLKIRLRTDKQDLSLLWSDQDFPQREVLGACKPAQQYILYTITSSRI